jgi:DNA-directed RNA polymerase subunit RPC12/RpoP
MNSYTVSAECPSCSAPLDFSEGTNAVQCLHCRSKLLVTGRKQTLSYFIAPQIDHYRAIAAAMRAHLDQGRECRVIAPKMYFMPYYRLVGNDFRWEEKPYIPMPSGAIAFETIRSIDDYQWRFEETSIDFTKLFKKTDVLLNSMFGNNETACNSFPIDNSGNTLIDNAIFRHALAHELAESAAQSFQLADRYIEKNFIACNLQGEGLYSLGLRPAALRLELYRKSELELHGKVVWPDLDINDAISRGMKDYQELPLLFRAVIGRILSVIYFPFWVIEMEWEDKNMLTIVDGVSQSVLKLDALPEIYEVLDQGQKSDPQIAGFRPLCCPNCGWDLPLRPNDVIFFCSSCDRAWQIYGRDLKDVPYQIARIDNLSGPVEYLPFWILKIQSGEAETLTHYIPAFRIRRLKCLADLAAAITRKQPLYDICEKDDMTTKKIHGCCYDAEDAFLLAQFVRAGIAAKTVEEMKAFQKDQMVLHSATLIWFPFSINGLNLVDPFDQMTIPGNLFE